MTDSAGAERSVTLGAGETQRLEGLAEGRCTVVQTKTAPAKKTFSLELSDKQSFVHSGAYATVTLMGSHGQVSVTKPDNKEGTTDGGRLYLFALQNQTGDELDRVALHAGETKVWQDLTRGVYGIRSLDDSSPAGFHLKYSNSSYISITGGSESSIKVTNHFSQEKGA